MAYKSGSPALLKIKRQKQEAVFCGGHNVELIIHHVKM
jgi:hypothetical protein